MRQPSRRWRPVSHPVGHTVRHTTSPAAARRFGCAVAVRPVPAVRGETAAPADSPLIPVPAAASAEYGAALPSARRDNKSIYVRPGRTSVWRNFLITVFTE